MLGMPVEFEKFPEERNIIGSILIAYGELEFGLIGCIDEVLHRQIDTSVRLLFRVQGESARIDVADALIRPPFSAMGLGGEWGNAVGAMRVCKKIRNQYAHCHWQLRNNELFFLNLHANAQSVEGNIPLQHLHIDLTLLQKQSEYFGYAAALIYYCFFQFQKLAGRKPSYEPAFPKSIPAPLLYNRVEMDADPR
jgi:hypothetical protein